MKVIINENQVFFERILGVPSFKGLCLEVLSRDALFLGGRLLANIYFVAFILGDSSLLFIFDLVIKF